MKHFLHMVHVHLRATALDPRKSQQYCTVLAWGKGIRWVPDEKSNDKR